MTGYAIHDASARAAVAATSTAIAGFDAPHTSITNAAAEASAGLPTQFAAAASTLAERLTEHAALVDLVRKYALSCTTSATTCLNIYSAAPVEMIAKQHEAESTLNGLVMFDTSISNGRLGSKVKQRLTNVNNHLNARASEHTRFERTTNRERSASIRTAGDVSSSVTKTRIDNGTGSKMVTSDSVATESGTITVTEESLKHTTYHDGTATTFESSTGYKYLASGGGARDFEKSDVSVHGKG
ncbi:MAG: hypothetical protein ACK5KO_07920 [Arachnia sp.]